MAFTGSGKSPGRRAFLPAGVIGALALLIAWVLTHLGGGMGSGSGSPDTNESSHAAPTAQPGPALPITVVIKGDGYWVGDQNQTADQIVAEAAGGNPGGTAVKIVSGPDARMGAQRDLEKALDQAHLPWALEAEPVAGQ